MNKQTHFWCLQIGFMLWLIFSITQVSTESGTSLRGKLEDFSVFLLSKCMAFLIPPYIQVLFNAPISQRNYVPGFSSQALGRLFYVLTTIFCLRYLQVVSLAIFSSNVCCFSSLGKFWFMWNRDKCFALVLQIALKQVRADVHSNLRISAVFPEPGPHTGNMGWQFQDCCRARERGGQRLVKMP